jgi:tRNA (cytidine/uridine-2'-O-)-methyltransferase
LDYDELTDVKQYVNWAGFQAANPCKTIWAYSTHGRKCYSEAGLTDGDGLLFGPETRGLPESILEETGPEQTLRIPMQQNSRSLNLSNTVAVGLYEALRQLEFPRLQ